MFHKISGIDKVYGKEGRRGGGREYQDFPSKFLGLSAEKIRRGTF